ncbi:hypothetical protein SLS58_003899 [Diplodia intermedia]|uniref:Uncharacterized protein n=1 Tax=Diplodia intermedia TaxID=856260 RepID=A0ABR3TUV5_9PEZI
MSDGKEAAVEDSPAPSQSGTAEFHDGTEEGKKAFLASFSAAEDKAIMRKVDRRFLVLIGLIYVIKNIDYMNAANVKVLQVGQPSNILNELSMTANQYNWVSYIIFEVPSNLVMKKVLARNWQTRIILSWGIVLACHAAVKNKEGLVYLLEGLSTILFASTVYLVLPDYPQSPRSHHWLTPREQAHLEARLAPTAPKTSDPPFSPREIAASLRDPRTHAFTLAQFLTNLAGYLPTASRPRSA